MPEMIRVSADPFAEVPHRPEPAERAEKAELDKPWRTVREMRSTFAALPHGAKGLLAEDLRRRSGRDEARDLFRYGGMIVGGVNGLVGM